MICAIACRQELHAAALPGCLALVDGRLKAPDLVIGSTERDTVMADVLPLFFRAAVAIAFAESSFPEGPAIVQGE